MLNVRSILALLSFVSLLPAFLTGCATTPQVADQALIGKYVPPAPPAADETYVYAIRGSAFRGGGRGVWVANNDKVVASLSNGSHALVKIKSGLNDVHLTQGSAGFGFTTVDNRPGETVFLFFDYTTGKVKEVPKDIGITMVMSTTDMPAVTETRANPAYKFIVMNPGMLGFDMMQASDQRLKPTPDSAVITFFRPAGLIKDVPFSIWSESAYLGDLKGDTYFQARVAPGHHTFMAKSERFSILKADVAAGKEYFAEFKVVRGWEMAHVKILPLDATADAAAIDGYFKKLKPVAVDTALVQGARLSPRIAAGVALVGEATTKAEAGEAASRELTVAAGR